MHKAFTKKWWYNFVESTQKLSQPRLVKSALTSEKATLSQLTLGLLSTIAMLPSSIKTRIWCGGKKLAPDLTSSFLNKPHTFSTIEEWCNASYGLKEIGIIINSCQNYSEELKQFIFLKTKHLVKFCGMPSEGNDITLFAGNYDLTPIGFHLDPPGHQTIHFQIGPGVKEMYLMSVNTYNKHLRRINKEQAAKRSTEQLISVAKKYTIEPGDLFFMPPGFYHVARNKGFSCSITFWYQNTDVYKVSQQLALNILGKLFGDRDRSLLPSDKSPVQSVAFQFRRFQKTFENKKWLLSGTVKSLIQNCLLEHKYRLYSNNFFAPRDNHAVDKPVKKSVSLDDQVRRNPFYRIYQHNYSDFSILFVQGEEIHVKRNRTLSEVVRILNISKQVKVADIVSLLQGSWTQGECLKFINDLKNRNAILPIPT